MLTVACVLRSGGDFDAEYVARLRDGVRKHLRVPHRFVCLSDVPVPCARIPLAHGWPGWWSKLELFEWLRGPTLYFDLDTVIVGSLHELAQYPHRFTMLADFVDPAVLASGVMAWDGDYSHILRGFDPVLIDQYKEKRRWGDQAWIAERVEQVDRWQDLFPGAFSSFKRGPRALDERVVCFHGTPRPRDVEWKAEQPHVDVREDRAVIVATGQSLDGFDLSALANIDAGVIAVNAAVSFAPADYWFTLDPSDANVRLMRNQAAGVRYFAAVPPEFGTRAGKSRVHRQTRPPNVTYLHRIAGSGPLGAAWGLSENQRAIHTGNSAYGALGLAYLMGARRIALLGVDGGGAYFYGGNGGDLSHLPQLFASALPQLQAADVEVVNGSPASVIDAFPRMSPADAIAWIEEP